MGRERLVVPGFVFMATGLAVAGKCPELAVLASGIGGAMFGIGTGEMIRLTANSMANRVIGRQRVKDVASHSRLN